VRSLILCKCDRPLISHPKSLALTLAYLYDRSFFANAIALSISTKAMAAAMRSIILLPSLFFTSPLEFFC
jgi:hypothetical protein